MLTVVSLCSVQNPLSQSILNVAFPSLQDAFEGTPAATMSWTLSLYSITTAATLVIAGVVSDRYGRKRMLLVGAVGFSCTSLASGLAPDVTFLLVMRTLQALFGSLLVPAGAALVLREFPPARRATAVAAWATSGSVASAIGPTLGAVLVDAGGWRWAFWVNVPFAVIGIALVVPLVRETEREQRPFPDLMSVPLVLVAVSGVVLGITQSARWGWGDARTLASVAVGVVVGALLVRRSARHPRPLLDLDLFRFPSFRIANIASITFGSTFFAVFLGFPRFTQEVWGFEVREAGLALLPIPIAGMLFNGLAGRFADSHGHRPVMVAGGLFQAVGGMVLVLGLDGEPNLLVWLTALTIIGLGTSLIWPAIFGNTVIGIPPDRYAEVTAVNQTAQRIANAAGTALAVSLVGERVGAGVGTYERIFVLTALGGVIAAILGMYMGERRVTRTVTGAPAAT